MIKKFLRMAALTAAVAMFSISCSEGVSMNLRLIKAMNGILPTKAMYYVLGSCRPMMLSCCPRQVVGCSLPASIIPVAENFLSMTFRLNSIQCSMFSIMRFLTHN